MNGTLWWALACALTILTALAAYQWTLALAALLPWRRRAGGAPGKPARFVVIVPAHNEETTLSPTLRSLAGVEYPAAFVRVIVVADRCSDGTAAVARAAGAGCLERRTGEPGKGAAIGWAIERIRADRVDFDAIVIIDADTIAHPQLFTAFDLRLRAGDDVQQGYNYLSNPWDTPFTRIISVTSVLRNGLFYGGKERIGLPAMLSGTGMCFSRSVLERNGWTAFSVGEDWEFSASLLLNGETVHFNNDARVMARESRGFRQASSQRLRWAGGRHAVAAAAALRLLAAGLRRRRFALCDAALTISAPTYSAQATAACVCLALGWALSGDPAGRTIAWWAAAVTGMLAGYFLLGLSLTESPAKAIAGVALIPVFLPWRMAIEILGLLGYGRKRWVRTARVPSGV